jgi:hypothetical protein
MAETLVPLELVASLADFRPLFFRAGRVDRSGGYEKFRAQGFGPAAAGKLNLWDHLSLGPVGLKGQVLRKCKSTPFPAKPCSGRPMTRHKAAVQKWPLVCDQRSVRFDRTTRGRDGGGALCLRRMQRRFEYFRTPRATRKVFANSPATVRLRAEASLQMSTANSPSIRRCSPACYSTNASDGYLSAGVC